MPSYSPQDVQDELLKVIRTSQETVVEAVKTWVDAVKAVAPKVPSPALPFADALPKPEDLVSGAFGLAEKLLASQRRFAGELFAATAPLLPGNDSDSQQGASFE